MESLQREYADMERTESDLSQQFEEKKDQCRFWIQRTEDENVRVVEEKRKLDELQKELSVWVQRRSFVERETEKETLKTKELEEEERGGRNEEERGERGSKETKTANRRNGKTKSGN